MGLCFRFCCSAKKDIPRYMVTAFCKKCSASHPTGVELELSEKISPTKSVAEMFDELPPEIVAVSRYYFLCPRTGEMYAQTDNWKVFLLKTK